MSERCDRASQNGREQIEALEVRQAGAIDAPTSVLALKRPPTHPGEVLLEEFLKPAEMTQVEAARRMGIPLNRLNEVIRGKRGGSADTALRLAKLLDTSAEIWLGLQNDWDLWHAAQALRPTRPEGACRKP